MKNLDISLDQFTLEDISNFFNNLSGAIDPIKNTLLEKYYDKIGISDSTKDAYKPILDDLLVNALPNNYELVEKMDGSYGFKNKENGAIS